MSGSARRVAVLTVSDTRGPADDAGGDLAERLLADAGWKVARHHVKDVVNSIQEAALNALADMDALVVTGGTGFGHRDVTPEAFEPMFQRRMAGYGERLRRLSEADVGPLALLSRAEAGTVVHGGREVPCFLVPGSPKAVQLAVSEVILPMLDHLLRMMEGKGHDHP